MSLTYSSSGIYEPVGPARKRRRIENDIFQSCETLHTSGIIETIQEEDGIESWKKLEDAQVCFGMVNVSCPAHCPWMSAHSVARSTTLHSA